jgi:cytochrome c5
MQAAHRSVTPESYGSIAAMHQIPRCIGFLVVALAGDFVFAQTAQELYMRDCAVCHLPGIAGAPKVGDKAEWSRRVRPAEASSPWSASSATPIPRIAR